MQRFAVLLDGVDLRLWNDNSRLYCWGFVLDGHDGCDIRLIIDDIAARSVSEGGVVSARPAACNRPASSNLILDDLIQHHILGTNSLPLLYVFRNVHLGFDLLVSFACPG